MSQLLLPEFAHNPGSSRGLLAQLSIPLCAAPSSASAAFSFRGNEGAAQRVAVLFARSNSVYKSLSGCDVFDLARNALNFSDSCPVIAHPPCRGWGRLRQFSKHEQSELELAHFAVAAVRRCGGVLEHPANSTLWKAASLPSPGAFDEFGGFTLPILQSWFGHAAPKATWLYIVGCTPSDLPSYPFELGIPSGRVEMLSRAAREHTPIELATWLVQVVRVICNTRTFSPMGENHAD